MAMPVPERAKVSYIPCINQARIKPVMILFKDSQNNRNSLKFLSNAFELVI